MFKSPNSKGYQRKNVINFVKGVPASKTPKIQQISSVKSISSMDKDFSIDQFKRQSPSNLLLLEVYPDKTGKEYRLTFPYSSDTTIQDLIIFLRKELNEPLLQLKTRNANIDYLLTLPNRRVREIQSRKLELFPTRIRIVKNRSALANFDILKCVGTGGFSKVYLARGYGRVVALKMVSKKFILENEKQNIIENERAILERCTDHPFITQLYLSVETDNYLVFCMEYCNGGELFNLLRKVRRMKEEEARFYFLQTFAAIAHLHSQQILYRDLKPENIIIDAEGHIRLADYGLSKIMSEDLTHSFCGSAEYMAPEMLLKKGHSYQIDYYCLGALLYELIIGLPPYYSRNQTELFSNIINKELQFPNNVEISKDLKKFLQKLLEKDPQQRFKRIQDILAHPWLKDINMQDVLQKRMNPPYETNMFQNNFDDADFAKDEQIDIAKIEKEKERLPPQNPSFPDFSFICRQFAEIEKNIQLAEEKRLDFSKKAPQTVLQHHQSQKQFCWRNNSMKNIQVQMVDHYPQHSPRVLPSNSSSKSNEKLKVLMTYNTQPSPYTSQISPYSHISNIRNSQIINNSGSKLLAPAKSVPYIDKNHVFVKPTERMASPINIYTSKSPPHHMNNNFLNNSNPSLNNSTQKKAMSYIHFTNNSFDKSINNSAYKNGSIGNNSIERVKFSSLDKPMATSSGTFLRNNAYQNQNLSPVQRGYLSNFKERFNPNPKIKKSYKNNEKFSFNFFNGTTAYKH